MKKCKMKNIVILIINLIILNLNKCNGQTYPESPCQNVFKYQEENGEIIGLIAVENIELNRENSIVIKFTNKPGSGVQSLRPIQNKQGFIDRIKNGEPIQFRVGFLLSNEIPEVLEIKWNDNLICKNSRIMPSKTSSVLSHRLPKIYDNTSPPLNRGITSQINIPTSTQQAPVFSFIRPRQRVEPQVEFVSQLEKLNEICGTITPFSSGQGEWPWLTALFKRSYTGREFHCGGSLISSRSVVTGGRCVMASHLDEYIVGVGIYDLQKINEEGSLYSNLKKIFVHPDFDSSSTTSYADIAIVILETAVNFSKNIRPVCLFDSEDDIENQIGVVVGWGSNVLWNVTTETVPTYVESKILQNCLISTRLFVPITSNTTFCARGILQGTRPCNGDNGNGLMIQKNGKWNLRGIVSISLFHPKKTCDPDEYVVYTDVAKFLKWIENNMEF